MNNREQVLNDIFDMIILDENNYYKDYNEEMSKIYDIIELIQDKVSPEVLDKIRDLIMQGNLNAFKVGFKFNNLLEKVL